MVLAKRPGRGGRRPGAGRPRGSKNKQAVVLSGRVDPVQVLEDIALDETAPHAARVSAAKALLEKGRQPTPAERPHPDADAKGIVWLKRSGTNG